jgi:universal stress protein E
MKHLLVIADQTGGKNLALQRALKLREDQNISITLLGFCYVNINHVDDEGLAKLSRKSLEKKLLALRKAELEDIAVKFAGQQHKLIIKAQWSKEIAPAIIAFCINAGIDLLCKSASGSQYMIKTPTDWQLLRECPTPVMITAVKTWRKKPILLAAIDFGTRSAPKQKLNDKIIAQAKQLAQLCKADLHIAYSLKVPQALIDLDVIDSKQFVKDKKAKLKPVIDKFCTTHNIGKDHLHIRQGHPVKIIPSIANKLKASLVVSGTVGRKGVKGKLMGNTAEGILENLRTDIVTVKP